MKKNILLFSMLIFTPCFLFAMSEKRGVSENQFQYYAQMEALAPGVGWYYNWGNVQGNYLNDQDFMEYVPMCWNGNYNADAIREFCTNHPETKYLLGFNEPNFKSQANMTPAEAAAEWPAVKALADELGLQLVAPALNYSPDAPYYQPTDWMDEFVSLVGLDAFDYTAVHAYGGFGVMSDLATKFHERYGKDVWVTEFCYWPEEGNNNSTVSPESQIAFMMEALEWLEKTEWIHRYSWFKAVGNSSSSTGPNYGLLISGRREDPRELSEQGKVYVNMSDFNSDFYHPVNSQIPPSEYISQSKALLGSTLDTQSSFPLEITRFNSGATLDYQFDVPEDGEYCLTLRVSGMGEPTRFDPNLGICAVNPDNTDGEVLCAGHQFALSNDDTVYESKEFPLNLKAGKQTLRLKDFGPYQPSGIRISSVALINTAGVNTFHATSLQQNVNVYNLQGVCVLKNISTGDIKGNLIPGIYIIDNKKVIIK